MTARECGAVWPEYGELGDTPLPRRMASDISRYRPALPPTCDSYFTFRQMV